MISFDYVNQNQNQCWRIRNCEKNCYAIKADLITLKISFFFCAKGFEVSKIVNLSKTKIINKVG
jgi:hypothetical protein